MSFEVQIAAIELAIDFFGGYRALIAVDRIVDIVDPRVDPYPLES
jgi:hypothetical protein